MDAERKASEEGTQDGDSASHGAVRGRRIATLCSRQTPMSVSETSTQTPGPNASMD